MRRTRGPNTGGGRNAVVLGAGAAALSAAATLAGIGVEVIVLERTEHVGAS